MRDGPSAETIEDLLRKDSHIESIIYDIEWSNGWRAPEINPSLWNDNKKELLDCFIDYVKSPYITDNFQNHPDRRAWKRDKASDQDFLKYYLRNALRIGRLAQISKNICGLVRAYKGTNPSEFKEVASKAIMIGNISLPDYDAKSTEEKIEYARAMKKEVIKILTFLSGQTREELVLEQPESRYM